MCCTAFKVRCMANVSLIFIAPINDHMNDHTETMHQIEEVREIDVVEVPLLDAPEQPTPVHERVTAPKVWAISS